MAVDPRLTGELEFHFEKSNLFRVVHVDGAIGSVSPSAQTLHMAVFSERTPFPRTVVQEVDQGTLGREMLDKRVSRNGVFREVEVDLVMTLETATAVRSWLDDRINEMTALKAIQANTQS